MPRATFPEGSMLLPAHGKNKSRSNPIFPEMIASAG
jgi:hypothetical protein